MLVPERKKKIWEGLYDKKNVEIRNQIRESTMQALKDKFSYR